jgi:hypothetical protein
VFGVSTELELGPFELKTLRVTRAGIAECALDERGL